MKKKNKVPILLLCILLMACKTQKMNTLSNAQLVVLHQDKYENSVAERCNTFKLFCPSLEQSFMGPNYSLLLKNNDKSYSVRQYIGYNDEQELSIIVDDEIYVVTDNDTPEFKDIVVSALKSDEVKLFKSVRSFYTNSIEDTRSKLGFAIEDAEHINNYLIVDIEKIDFKKHLDSEQSIYRWSDYRLRMFKCFIKKKLVLLNKQLDLNLQTKNIIIRTAMELKSLNNNINECPEPREFFTALNGKVDSITMDRLLFEYIALQFAPEEKGRKFLKENHKHYRSLEQCFIWDLCKEK